MVWLLDGVGVGFGGEFLLWLGSSGSSWVFSGSNSGSKPPSSVDTSCIRPAGGGGTPTASPATRSEISATPAASNHIGIEVGFPSWPAHYQSSALMLNRHQIPVVDIDEYPFGVPCILDNVWTVYFAETKLDELNVMEMLEGVEEGKELVLLGALVKLGLKAPFGAGELFGVGAKEGELVPLGGHSRRLKPDIHDPLCDCQAWATLIASSNPANALSKPGSITSGCGALLTWAFATEPRACFSCLACCLFLLCARAWTCRGRGMLSFAGTIYEMFENPASSNLWTSAWTELCILQRMKMQNTMNIRRRARKFNTLSIVAAIFGGPSQILLFYLHVFDL